MSTQRKLRALLHELQYARSPLAQARTVARAWRTVREISPTDRRLLARHLAFDGSEEILDALAGRKGGLAPAMLLRALAEVRTADGSTLQELVAALRDPERRAEAVVRGANLAANVLEDKTNGDATRESFEMIDAHQPAETTGPEEVPEKARPDPEPVRPEISQMEEPVLPAEPEDEAEGFHRKPDGQETIPEVEPQRESAEPPPKNGPPTIDWGHWEPKSEDSSPPPDTQRCRDALDGERRGMGELARRDGIGAAAEGQSVLSRLLTFRRKIRGSSASGFDELQHLVEAFPDGWTRRRAIRAVFDEGFPDRIDDALELVSSLGRESDRRWCLCDLAARGLLRGESLERAVALLDTRLARRRVEHIAGLAV